MYTIQWQEARVNVCKTIFGFFWAKELSIFHCMIYWVKINLLIKQKVGIAKVKESTFLKKIKSQKIVYITILDHYWYIQAYTLGFRNEMGKFFEVLGFVLFYDIILELSRLYTSWTLNFFFFKNNSIFCLNFNLLCLLNKRFEIYPQKG